MRFRRLTNRHRPELKFCLIYADGMINNKIINDDIVCPLVAYQFPKDTGDDLAEYLMDCVVTSNDAEKTPEMENIVQRRSTATPYCLRKAAATRCCSAQKLSRRVRSANRKANACYADRVRGSTNPCS